jgi:hypothetical protein
MSISVSLEKMSIEEKLQMMELLWEDLSLCSNKMTSPLWHGDILQNREENLKRGTEQFEDWEEAKRKIEEDIQ